MKANLFLVVACVVLMCALASSLAVSNHRQLCLEQRREQAWRLTAEVETLKERLVTVRTNAP